MLETQGNPRKTENKKQPYRKTKIYFSHLKNNNVIETHKQKVMHTGEPKMWKYTLWTYKYSFGEEVHVSPDGQTQIVFDPIWKNIKIDKQKVISVLSWKARVP